MHELQWLSCVRLLCTARWPLAHTPAHAVHVDPVRWYPAAHEPQWPSCVRFDWAIPLGLGLGAAIAPLLAMKGIIHTLKTYSHTYDLLWHKVRHSGMLTPLSARPAAGPQRAGPPTPGKAVVYGRV